MLTSPPTHAQMPHMPALAIVLGSRLAFSKASTLRPRPAWPVRPCAHVCEEVSI
jgi:hypothetical protein